MIGENIRQSQLGKLLEATKYAVDDHDITAVEIDPQEFRNERREIDQAILESLGIQGL